VTLLGYDVAMSLSPLLQRSHFVAQIKGTSEPSAEAITVRPDAKTGNRTGHVAN
jgi:hypothetical protein